MKWIDEKVLQYYFKENCSSYKLKVGDAEKTIESCRFNIPFDDYPDLFCSIDGKTYPIEVEWSSTDYDHDKRTPEKHKEFVTNEGFLVVYTKTAEIQGLRQIEVNPGDFRKWFRNNAGRIFDESVKSFRDELIPNRSYPKIFVIYLGREAERNFVVAQTRGVWGFTTPRFRQSSSIILHIKKNDIVLFIGPTIDIQSKEYHSSRDFRPTEYFNKVKGNPNLIITNVKAFRIVKGYWDEVIMAGKENRPYHIVWPDETEENRKYPHRFEFENEPIINFKNIRMNRIAKSTIESLRKIMLSSPDEVDAIDFVELVRNVRV